MKHGRKKPQQLSEAVFRGKKVGYDFEVYPLNIEFNDVPAVYVISRRKTDKRGKAHHALVCIGQTETLSSEVKKHKRGKCVKQRGANVISVLLEDNEKRRLTIETDLKAAHKIPCVHGSEIEIEKSARQIEPKLPSPAAKPVIETRKIKPETLKNAAAKKIEVKSSSAKTRVENKPSAKTQPPKSQPKAMEKVSAKTKAARKFETSKTTKIKMSDAPVKKLKAKPRREILPKVKPETKPKKKVSPGKIASSKTKKAASPTKIQKAKVNLKPPKNIKKVKAAPNLKASGKPKANSAKVKKPSAQKSKIAPPKAKVAVKAATPKRGTTVLKQTASNIGKQAKKAANTKKTNEPAQNRALKASPRKRLAF